MYKLNVGILPEQILLIFHWRDILSVYVLTKTNNNCNPLNPFDVLLPCNNHFPIDTSSNHIEVDHMLHVVSSAVLPNRIQPDIQLCVSRSRCRIAQVGIDLLVFGKKERMYCFYCSKKCLYIYKMRRNNTKRLFKSGFITRR